MDSSKRLLAYIDVVEIFRLYKKLDKGSKNEFSKPEELKLDLI